MIIAVDFDGTIVDHDFPAIGSLRENAAEILQKLDNEGHQIVIWTCRTGQVLEEAYQFLVANKIPFVAINENAPIVKHTFDCLPKIYADLYIDDRQVGGLPGWWQIYHYIHTYMGAGMFDPPGGLPAL